MTLYQNCGIRMRSFFTPNETVPDCIHTEERLGIGRLVKLPYPTIPREMLLKDGGNPLYLRGSFALYCCKLVCYMQRWIKQRPAIKRVVMDQH